MADESSAAAPTIGAAEKKADLAQRKLELEVQALDRSASSAGRALEWFKAFAVPVALLSLVVTALFDYSQVNLATATRNNQEKQALRNEEDQQFNTALSRFAENGDNPRARRFSVAGLRNFVFGDDKTYRSSALVYLVNAYLAESDEEARLSILEIFRELNPADAQVNGLTERRDHPVRPWKRDKSVDAALDVALRSCRNIIEALENHTAKTQAAEVWKLDSGLPGALNKAAFTSQLRKSRTALALLSLTDEQRFTVLRGVSEMIQQLTNAGGYNTDFSGIYCWDCLFRPGADMRGVVFDGAHLHHAIMRNVDLVGASFADADIGGADLTGANLRNADLTVDEKGNGLSSSGIRGVFRETVWRQIWGLLPDLKGADLRGADLTGLPLASVERSVSDDGVSYSYVIRRISTAGALVDKTTMLKNLTVILEDTRSLRDLRKKTPDAKQFIESLSNGNGPDWLTEFRNTSGGLVFEVDGGIEFTQLMHYSSGADFETHDVSNFSSDGRMLLTCAFTMRDTSDRRRQGLAVERVPLNKLIGISSGPDLVAEFVQIADFGFSRSCKHHNPIAMNTERFRRH